MNNDNDEPAAVIPRSARSARVSAVAPPAPVLGTPGTTVAVVEVPSTWPGLTLPILPPVLLVAVGHAGAVGLLLQTWVPPPPPLAVPALEVLGAVTLPDNVPLDEVATVPERDPLEDVATVPEIDPEPGSDTVPERDEAPPDEVGGGVVTVLLLVPPVLSVPVISDADAVAAMVSASRIGTVTYNVCFIRSYFLTD